MIGLLVSAVLGASALEIAIGEILIPLVFHFGRHIAVEIKQEKEKNKKLDR